MAAHTTDLSRAVWQKSTYSGGNGGQCVEIARNLPGIVAVRDSKDPGGLVLTFGLKDWKTFTSSIKAGWFGL